MISHRIKGTLKSLVPISDNLLYPKDAGYFKCLHKPTFHFIFFWKHQLLAQERREQKLFGKDISTLVCVSALPHTSFPVPVLGADRLRGASRPPPQRCPCARDSSHCPIPLPNRTLGHNRSVGTARGGMKGTTTITTITTKEAASIHAAKIPGAERCRSKGATC